MEKTLNVLHDLFAAMKKEVKRYLHIVEPKTTNPSNDYERMLVRKALGIEYARKKRIKQMIQKLNEWLDEGNEKDLTQYELIELYADLRLECFALQAFSQHVEDARVLDYETDENELDKMQESVQAQVNEFQTILDDIQSKWVEPSTSKEVELKQTIHSDRPTFSVGSLL
ncbi:hypothetical protein ACTHQ4_16160 [Alkalicoccobacillus gibsonii]|uniref:hypothetical protein n=1 Tax=Alkalicoccobacillus gibsonii TaxID=79881 RepID=UPI003F7BB46E